MQPTSKQFRTSTHTPAVARIDMRLSRSEHYSARTARLNAVIRESDRELREAVRGTWIEAELAGAGGADDDEAVEVYR